MRRLFYDYPIKLHLSLLGEHLSFLSQGPNLLQIKVSIFPARIGHCQFAVNHNYLFILVEELEVAPLQFYC
jgi:hypothetical protein